MTTEKNQNTLGDETSPYLLQHAGNPVNWFPWCDTALNAAREQDKPIFLSIGYSACHWCHVMAHESFEDEETAKIMNEHFINIKVDREERPDLDKIYQMAQQLLTQRTGGWPLTMFLTPDDHVPFFGGTYFPPEPRYGMPGFRNLLVRVAEYYRSERDAIRKQNTSMQEALDRISQSAAVNDHQVMNEEPLHMAVRQLEQSFDHEYGGFGGAPKFPHPTNIERLLRHYVIPENNDTDKEQCLSMARLTLQKMAQGGIYDQLGGGFYRYSVDNRWMIPHFEKMLYDNGPLLTLYCEAWRLTHDVLFENVACDTADWIIRDMQSDEGGFYSTLDADSEGQEGKFYVWDPEEIKSLLDDQEFKLFSLVYGLDASPNFEGHWHLQVVTDPDTTGVSVNVNKDAVTDLLHSARMKLLEVRNQRIWPGRDEKVLTSWNGLMIKGMATAAMTFNSDTYRASATRALEFIRTTLWQDGRLCATYKDGRARFNAYLDDYVCVIESILALLQVQWDRKLLDFAVALADTLLDQFEDTEKGGFYFTSHDHERLIQRNKPLMDDSLPSGNGIAASVLGSLGHLLGDDRYLKASERTLKFAWSSIQNYPAACNALLLALEDYLHPARSIIIRGEKNRMKSWIDTCKQSKDPFTTVLAIPTDECDLPGLLNERAPRDETVAYICTGHQCLEPVTRLDLLSENLNNP